MSSNAPYGSSSDGDAFYVADCRQIQQNIKLIENSTNTAKKLCNENKQRSENDISNIDKAIHGAKECAFETQKKLRLLREHANASRPDRAQRQLMCQKLTQSFSAALRELETVGMSQLMKDNFMPQEKKGSSQDSYNVSSSYSSYEPPSSRDADDTYPHAHTHTHTHTHMPPHTRQRYTNAGGVESCIDRDGIIGVKVTSGDLDAELLREREAALLSVRRDIQGIHKLCEEMAIHVHHQGTDLDNIETSVRRGAEHTLSATDEIQHASVTHRRAKRRNIIVGMILIIVCLALGKAVYNFLRF